jgi:hypothetical protein
VSADVIAAVSVIALVGVEQSSGVTKPVLLLLATPIIDLLNA